METLSQKLPIWQERFMEKLNQEYIELLSSDGNASDNFGELEKRIHRDKKMAGVCVHMARSEMIFQLMQLLAEGAISLDELDGFSNELRERIEFIYKNHYQD